MSAAPHPHPEIHGANGPAAAAVEDARSLRSPSFGRASTTSPRAPAVASVGALAPVAVSVRSLPVPDAMDLARACRFSAAAHLLEMRRLERDPAAPSGRAADLAATAVHLEAAAERLERLAHDPFAEALAETRAHLAAGGVVRFEQADGVPPVVVAPDRETPKAQTVAQRLVGGARGLLRRRSA